jgi:non-heme chloroperoxidase
VGVAQGVHGAHLVQERHIDMEGNYFRRGARVIPLLVMLSPVFARGQGLEPVATHMIEVETGVTLHVVDWGGKGDPLLFLPSWASTSHVFDQFAPRFADTQHVLVMNLRGHGASSKPTPESGYTIERLTKDVEVILDRLGISRVTLVGLSRSASVVTQFAARYPSRVKAVIYLSGPIDREYDRAFSARPSIRPVRIEQSRTDDAIEEACGVDDKTAYGRVFPPGTDDDAANKLGTEWRNTDPAPPYSLVKAPALGFWAPITARVLQHRLACATAGKLNADVERLLARLTKASIPFFEREVRDMALFKGQMADGSIVIIPGADYNTFLTHPDLVEEEIRLFLKSH